MHFDVPASAGVEAGGCGDKLGRVKVGDVQNIVVETL